MDWYVDSANPEAIPTVTRELLAYLCRDASVNSDLRDAERAFGEAMANALKGSANACWVEVDWTDESPVVSIHDLGCRFPARGIS